LHHAGAGKATENRLQVKSLGKDFAEHRRNGADKGMDFVQAAVYNQVGRFGPLFITVSIFLFAFSSLVGNYYYTEANFRFIRDSRRGLLIFRCTCVRGVRRCTDGFFHSVEPGRYPHGADGGGEPDGDSAAGE